MNSILFCKHGHICISCLTGQGKYWFHSSWSLALVLSHLFHLQQCIAWSISQLLTALTQMFLWEVVVYTFAFKNYWSRQLSRSVYKAKALELVRDGGRRELQGLNPASPWRGHLLHPVLPVCCSGWRLRFWTGIQSLRQCVTKHQAAEVQSPFPEPAWLLLSLLPWAWGLLAGSV